MQQHLWGPQSIEYSKFGSTIFTPIFRQYEDERVQQLINKFALLTKMAIFPDVTGVGAITADFVLFHRAFAPVLASVRPGTRIDELAIIQRYFSHNSVSVHHVSRLYPLVVHPYLAHTSDQTYTQNQIYIRCYVVCSSRDHSEAHPCCSSHFLW